MNEVMTTGASEMTNWAPRNFGEAQKFASIVCQTNMVPKDYKGKEGDCLVAMMMGNEVGLGPLAALQNIAVINGRPVLWGDAALALVKASSDYEYLQEEFSPDNTVAICKAKRKGEKEVVRKFSVGDAQNAGLWKKAGPWTTYPTRMMMLRARSWAIRDTWPHVLKGLAVGEEVQDIPMQNVTPSESAKEMEGTVETVSGEDKGPEKDPQIEKILHDLEVSLINAVNGNLLSEEEKVEALTMASQMDNKDRLEKFALKISERLVDKSVEKESGNESA